MVATDPCGAGVISAEPVRIAEDHPCRVALARGYRAGGVRRSADDRSGIGAVFEGVAAVFNDKVFVSVRNISTRST